MPRRFAWLIEAGITGRTLFLHSRNGEQFWNRDDRGALEFPSETAGKDFAGRYLNEAVVVERHELFG